VDWAPGLLSRSACSCAQDVGRTRAGGVKKDSGNNGRGDFHSLHYCATRLADDERHRRLWPTRGFDDDDGIW
jgi:hypothetical protein